jgi:hypothetical protein
MSANYNFLVGGDTDHGGMFVELQDGAGVLTERNDPGAGFPALGVGKKGTRTLTLLLILENAAASEKSYTLKVKSPDAFVGSTDATAQPPLSKLLPRITELSTANSGPSLANAGEIKAVLGYEGNSVDDSTQEMTFTILLRKADGTAAIDDGTNGVFEITLDFGYSASN